MLCGFLRLSPGFTFRRVLISLSVSAQHRDLQLIDSIRLRTISGQNPQEWGPSGLRIATGVPASFRASIPSSLLPLEQIRKRQEGFAEIAVWSDQTIQSGHRRRSPQSKRHSRQRRFFFTSLWSSRSWEAAWPQDDQPGCGASAAEHQLLFLAAKFLPPTPQWLGKPLTLVWQFVSGYRRHTAGIQWYFHRRHL